MTTAVELERIAAGAIPMIDATDVVAIVAQATPGGRLSNGSPSGLGVEVRYGAAWFDGIRRSEPIAMFERQRDAFALIDLLTGRALRSAPRSVAAVSEGRSSGEGRGPERPHGQLDSVSRTPARGTRRLDGAARARAAGARAPGVNLEAPETVGADPDGSLGQPSSIAGAADAVPGASRAGRFCKACGADLSARPPSRTGQTRMTCDDACRQAFHRGQRAPIPGVVDQDELTRLSRLSRPNETATGREDPARDPAGSQLALGAPA